MARNHPSGLAVLLVVLLSAAACGSSAEKFTSAKAIRSRGKIIVGVKFEPGLGMRDPSTHRFEGFDVTIARYMAAGIFGTTTDGLGDRIEFVEALSKDREADLDNGNVDLVVATYTINDARKQVVDFAGPYLNAHQDIMVGAGDTSIAGVGDLNDKMVCTATGSTSADNLTQKAPQVELTLRDTYTQCAQALAAGQVAAVSTDDTILAGLVAGSGGAFKLIHAPFSDEPYGIGLPKGDTSLRSLLNDRLQQMEKSGQWAEAFEASLGKLGLATPLPPPIDRYRMRP